MVGENGYSAAENAFFAEKDNKKHTALFYERVCF